MTDCRALFVVGLIITLSAYTALASPEQEKVAAEAVQESGCQYFDTGGAVQTHLIGSQDHGICQVLCIWKTENATYYETNSGGCSSNAPAARGIKEAKDD